MESTIQSASGYSNFKKKKKKNITLFCSLCWLCSELARGFYFSLVPLEASDLSWLFLIWFEKVCGSLSVHLHDTRENQIALLLLWSEFEISDWATQIFKFLYHVYTLLQLWLENTSAQMPHLHARARWLSYISRKKNVFPQYGYEISLIGFLNLLHCWCINRVHKFPVTIEVDASAAYCWTNLESKTGLKQQTLLNSLRKDIKAVSCYTDLSFCTGWSL